MWVKRVKDEIIGVGVYISMVCWCAILFEIRGCTIMTHSRYSRWTNRHSCFTVPPIFIAF